MSVTLARTLCVFAMFSGIAWGCSEDAAGARPQAIAHGGTGGAASAAAAGGNSSGTGGGAGAGAGGQPEAGTGSGGSPAETGGKLDLHIEDAEAFVVDLVTVSCSGECVEVKAVAKGGNPPYAFRWDDGSSELTRKVCPESDATFTVTATDTAIADSEFAMPAQVVNASVTAEVLECPVAEVDAGAGSECESNSDCAGGQICFEQTCVGDGGLRFSLTWNVDTDFDLFVRTPGGTLINYVMPMAEGGTLDVDDCVARECRRPGGPHVENIYFPMEAPRGTYTYWVSNAGLALADDFSIEVSVDGTVQATQTAHINDFVFESDRFTFLH